MSVLNNSLLLGQEGGAGYVVQRSLRFSSIDSAYLSRTPASAGNRKTWTWAAWVKRSALNSFQRLFYASNECSIRFEEDNTLRFSNYTGAFTAFFKTTAVYRDTSAWYHIVLTVDTTNATSSDRLRLYVNGERITTFSSTTYPTQSLDLEVNKTSEHRLGDANGSEYFSGYLAECHFIDGQQLTPSSFTEVDATTGQLVPKAYTGSFGTNGFWLKFSDNSAATATTLGKDYSGNNNNWSPTNLSVTAGAGNDSLVDTPTSYGTDTGAGGEVRGNYATLNPLRATASLTNGNLDHTNTSTGFQASTGTIYVSSGKWYWEVTVANANLMIGAATNDHPLDSAYSASTTSWTYFGDNGQKYGNGANGVSYGSSFTSGDIIGVALDMDAGTIAFYKNNVSQGTAFSTGISGKSLTPLLSGYNSAVLKGQCNFGQRPFAYTAPSGFKALCTTNLPTPVVAKPNTVMDVKLWTGNSGTQTISGLGFSPDLIWAKVRNATASNQLFDVIRGVNKALYSDSTSAEFTDTDAVTAFNSDGWTMGAEGGLNFNGNSYVAWTWDAGSSTVTNTSGSISSQVRASVSSNFSIVSYTGNDVNGATVGHGLNVTPSMIIVKSRAAGANYPAAVPWSTVGNTGDWFVFHASLGASSVIKLNSTDAAGTLSSLGGVGGCNSTTFTCTQGSTVDRGITYSTQVINTASTPYVAYCFAPVAGYSSFGSYTGNGSADGPFVYTGFRPRWIMIKNSGATGNWLVSDTARDPSNLVKRVLLPNLSNAEDAAADYLDLLSNGFKFRAGGSAAYNANVNTYIYVAFAESPFAYSRAR